MKITIKGKFEIESDTGMTNNIKMPLEYLELEIFPPLPFRINALRSSQVKLLEGE